MNLAGSVQKSIGKHKIAAGASWQRRMVRIFEVANLYEFMRTLRSLEDGDNDTGPYEDQIWLRWSGNVHAFGYDIFGKQINLSNDVNDAARRPSRLGFYIDDQFRTKNLEILLGLRYDRFSSDALTFADPKEPKVSGRYFNSGFYIPIRSVKTVPSYGYFSPRLSAVYRAHNNLALQIQLGKYVQHPKLQDIYASRTNLGTILARGEFYNYVTTNFDPLVSNAKPVRSTQTVLGLSYSVKKNFRFEASFYRKVITGQLQVEKVVTAPNSNFSEYLSLSNAGKSNAKGMEISLGVQHEALKMWMNYTLSDVNGSNSYPFSNLSDFPYSGGESEGEEVEKRSPLEFNRKHRGAVMLSYEVPTNAPPWLRNTGIYTLYRFNSGRNYTRYYFPATSLG